MDSAGVAEENFPEACQAVAVGYLACWPRQPLSGWTRYDAAAAAVEGIDCVASSCEQPAAARLSAVVAHQAALEVAAAPSVVVAPSAFVIVEDVVAVEASLALARELDASPQSTPVEVAFRSEMNEEREPSAPATAVEIVAAVVVANVVVAGDAVAVVA